MDVTTAINSVNELLTLWIAMPLIFITGIYLTVRLRCVQIFSVKTALRHLFTKEEGAKGTISNFEAVAAVLAGNLGTGNISGMAMAISMGGPGALVWMWIMGFFGAVIKYAGCLLGVRYRQVNAEGEFVGGPMYYLSHGLKARWLAAFFCIATIATAFTVGNLVQVNSLILPLHRLGIPPLVMGIAIAVMITVIIIGGIQRIAKVVTAVVPSMTLLYLLAAIVILGLHANRLPEAFALMLSAAIHPGAIAGGTLGYTVAHALSIGFERGIFATDAGAGIAPVLQSSARTKDASTEGAVAMLAPLVVMVVCTITSLVLIVTDAWKVPGLKSTNMCTWAFKTGLGHSGGETIVVVALFLFGLTTILAWGFCAEKAVEYLVGLKGIQWFNYLFIACIPIGALAKVELVWALADLSIGLMLCCNMVGVIGLRKEVIEATAHTPS